MKKFLTAATWLTLMSFVLKGLGMLFRGYLSSRMGAVGLGLYQLIMSVYSVFATFATSGFTMSVSRLAAERLGDGKGRSGALRVLCVASGVAFGLGVLSFAVLFCGADFLARGVICDYRTAQPLKLLAFSMPFMALSACLKGYLMAIGQIYKPSIASLFEQIAKIGITVYIFDVVYTGVKAPSTLCTALVTGITAGEVLSYVFLFLLYAFFSGRTKESPIAEHPAATLKSVVRVTVPIAAGGYMSTLLHSTESVLLPIQLIRYGGDRSTSLAQLGIIRGMAIPLLFFPYAFLGSLLSVKIPDVALLNTKESKHDRNVLIRKILAVSAAVSLATGAVFFLLPSTLCRLFYGSAEGTHAVRVLATVTPFMYMETVSDGLLKAIDEQKRTLAYGTVNSVLRIAAVLTVVPLFGSDGYLWLLVASNTLSFALCFGRLWRVTKC